MKKIILSAFTSAFALCLLVNPTYSQTRTKAKDKFQMPTFHQKWEVGMMLGAAQYRGDLNNLGSGEINPGLGAAVRYHFNDNFALRTSFIGTKISGDDINSKTNAARNFNFSARVRELSVVGEFDLMGKRRFDKNSFKKTFSPYLLGGLALANILPETNFFQGSANDPEMIQKDKNTNINGALLCLPVGLGFKYDINRDWTFNLEAGYRFTYSDYLDGVSMSANPLNNDGYAFAGVMIAYRIPAVTDSDGDGIKDQFDKCPSIKGSKKSNGCPDQDGDGIEDIADKCPTKAGTLLTEGCPDTDEDGIADDLDKCPTEKGQSVTGGCPDNDADGIANADDKCPDEFGSQEDGGCPKIKDADGDGVEDSKDKCPDMKGLALYNGCPADTDGDGFYDFEDKCPELFGKTSGCPTLTETDKKVLEGALYGVQFETASATIKESSFAVLDKVIDIMNRYPNYILKINGHTDDTGTAEENLTLSENRSKSCYMYLINKGVSQDRISYKGYGKTMPIVENNSEKNRAMNRRVEFELYERK